MYEAGTAKTDITAFKRDVGMMGYGMHFNIVKGIASRLHARAYAIRHTPSGKKFVFVNAEMCFIDDAVKLGVIKKLNRGYPDLGYSDTNVLLTAQHTHSGPGGYSHYGFYNLTIPGFVPEVYQEIVNGLVEAIVQADAALRPARLFLHRGEFAADQEVAFNRSLRAYNRNADVEKVPAGHSHLAVDRTMWLLRIDGTDGERIGAVNWFAVHTTSISNDNHLIHFDNKGYAAQWMEMDMQQAHPGFLAAFAQGAAGDVSPNFIWDRKKRWMRGKYKDDFESARFNARIQLNKAKEIYDEACDKGIELKGELDFRHTLVNFANVECHPDFTEGLEGMRTTPSCHGVSFFAGTDEGPGMPGALAFASRRLTGLMKGYEYLASLFWSSRRRYSVRTKYRMQAPKHILVETGQRRVLATRDVKNLVVPGAFDKSVATFKEHHRRGGLDHKPWIPQVLPLQIIVLGNVALLAIPAEPTTVSGRRLRDTVAAELKKRGVDEVILTPYANSYCGYITTPEEYQEQRYEGGHTVFGRWQLAAFQTKFRELARELVKHAGDRKPLDPAERHEFTEEELSLRAFPGDEGEDILPEELRMAPLSLHDEYPVDAALG